MSELSDQQRAELAALQLMQLARAAMKRGHGGSVLDLVGRVVAMEPELPPGVDVDGTRRHRLVSAAVAMSVAAHIARGESGTAVDLARRAWEADPVDPFLAGAYARALHAAGGSAGVLDAFGLVRQRRGDIADDPDVPVCLTICRNELLQLPSFLDHHRRLGVRRFIVVDNGSTDGSVEYTIGQPDVDLWSTDLSFHSLAFGANAFMAIALAELRDRWLLLLDADERFVSPQPPEDLRSIVARLDRDGHEAMSGALLDVYDDQPLLAPRGTVATDLEGTVYFDRVWAHDARPDSGHFANGVHFTGGVRRRVFGSSSLFLLSKVPLLKFTDERLLVGGQHDSNADGRVRSRHHVAILHTKFLAGTDRLSVEAVRGAYPNAASDYVTYAQVLSRRPELTLFDPEMSVRYTGPQQLVAMGIAR